MKSIITKDLNICIVCGSTVNIEKHHCIHGTSGRKLATRYHLLVGLCSECHRGTWGVHGNKEDITHLDLCLKQMAQKAFEKKHGDRFFEVFGENFLASPEEDLDEVRKKVMKGRLNEVRKQEGHQEW